MKRVRTLLALAIISIISLNAEAQTFRLNEIINPAESNLKSVSGKQFISINNQLFENDLLTKGSELEVQLDSETFKQLEIVRKSRYTNGSVSFIAKETGEKGSVFSFTYSNDTFNGILFNQGSEHIDFVTENNAKFMTKQSDNNVEHLQCALNDDNLEEWSTKFYEDAKKVVRQKTSSLAGNEVIDSREDTVTIDLLIVYTEAAANWAVTSSFRRIEDVVAQAMNLSQTALDNSDTKVDLRLVSAIQIDHDETTDEGSGETLRKLTASPEYNPWGEEPEMDEVHDYRDSLGADVVSILARVDDTGGLGWVVTQTTGDDRFAFNLNRVQQVAGGFTLIHEIGHNIGNFHSRTQPTQQASPRGGLHQYSVGYQAISDTLNSVMGYAWAYYRIDPNTGQQEGNPFRFTDQAPVFSGPDVFWNGVAMGDATVNAAQSIRDTKRMVAGYRDTKFEVPVIEAGTNAIDVTLNQGESITVPLEISNTGDSRLFWELDFSVSNPVLAKQTAPTGNKLELPIKLNPFKDREVFTNNDFDVRKSKAAFTDSLLFTNGFELADGFFGSPNGPTEYDANRDWQAVGGDDKVVISRDNPFAGIQHLRMGMGNLNGHYVESPYLGRLPFGNYEFSMDFMITGPQFGLETFDLFIYDRKKKETSGGIVISDNGVLYTYTRDEFGNGGYFSTPSTVSPDVFHNLRIVFNTDNWTVDYYMDGLLIRSSDFVDGFTPDEFWFGNREQTVDSYFDIDNVEVRRSSAPFSWLLMNSFSGSANPGESVITDLNFVTEDMEPGTYSADLIVRSNDSETPAVTIPINFTISGTVSNEEELIPTEISLDQNYPNPFNPSTNITYSISKAGAVSLEVYNIQGQKVATLVQAQQAAGEYSVTFDASNLSSGIYIYSLKTGSASISKRMVLVK